MINLKNYEEFALDYLEGNLSNEQRRDFEAFLETQPEIKTEILTMNEFVIASADESIIFGKKDALLKEENGAKIIILNTQFWYRATAAIAAIGLLLIGYLLGYKSANLEPDPIQIVNEVPVNNFEKEEKNIVNNDYQNNENEVNAKVGKENLNQIEETSESYSNANFKHDLVEIKDKPNLNNYPPSNNQSISDAIEKYSENNEIKNQESAIANNNLNPTLLPLSKKSPELLKTTLDSEMKFQALYLSDMIILNQNPEEALVKTPEPAKGHRIRDLFGRLPFEGVTKEAFIPSYFTDDAGR